MLGMSPEGGTFLVSDIGEAGRGGGSKPLGSPMATDPIFSNQVHDDDKPATF
jgi:hypothetical protein